MRILAVAEHVGSPATARTGSRCASHGIWNPLQMPSTGSPTPLAAYVEPHRYDLCEKHVGRIGSEFGAPARGGRQVSDASDSLLSGPARSRPASLLTCSE